MVDPPRLRSDRIREQRIAGRIPGIETGGVLREDVHRDRGPRALGVAGIIRQAGQ